MVIIIINNNNNNNDKQEIKWNNSQILYSSF